MIAFRNVVQGAPVVNFWNNGKNQIAFSRGTRGFIAFNNEPFHMNVKLFTSLSSGEYCDVITGSPVESGKCTGTKVIVDENGEAEINIPTNVGVLAIHIGVNLLTEVYLRIYANSFQLNFYSRNNLESSQIQEQHRSQLRLHKFIEFNKIMNNKLCTSLPKDKKKRQ